MSFICLELLFNFLIIWLKVKHFCFYCLFLLMESRFAYLLYSFLSRLARLLKLGLLNIFVFVVFLCSYSLYFFFQLSIFRTIKKHEEDDEDFYCDEGPYVTRNHRPPLPLGDRILTGLVGQ